MNPLETAWAPFRRLGHRAHDRVPPFRWSVHFVARLWNEPCACDYRYAREALRELRRS